MIAATGAIRVEIGRLHAVLHQVFARRAVFLDGAGRGDVISGHTVTEYGEHSRRGNILDRYRLERHVVKIRRALDVSRFTLPGIRLALRRGQLLPALVTRKNGGVILAEHL